MRRIRNEFELQDLVEKLGKDPVLVERDFALVAIAAGLVAEYGEALCFKGGFVLRHVYGHERFSKDIDATRINPPKSKLDSKDVATTIRSAGMRNVLTLTPGEPVTDTGRSLDFASIRYAGPLGQGTVSVEVSYREALVEAPVIAAIGEPYFDPFEVPVMEIHEIVAEKLRALAQRDRPTDLSDVAMVLDQQSIDPNRVRTIAAVKFQLVKQTDNRERITNNILGMRAGYGAAVSAVAPDAPTYTEASDVVLRHLSALLPG